jgi:hemin uptake protein HemP
MTVEKDPQEAPQDNRAVSAGESKTEEIVPSLRLFGGRREIWIEHAGERYRLRITRRNKLILQK